MDDITKINKSKQIQWLLIALMIVVFLGSIGGGIGLTSKYYKNKNQTLDSILKSKDSIIKSHENILAESEKYIYELDTLVNSLESLNRNRKNEIRWKETIIFIDVDSSYINNAKRIADSVDRFYNRKNNFR